MDAKYLSREKGYFSLLGMIISLAIIYFLAYIMLNTYFSGSLSAPGRNNITADAGIDNIGSVNAAGYSSVINRTKGALDAASKQQEKRISGWGR